jgi:hypothetical protein
MTQGTRVYPTEEGWLPLGEQGTYGRDADGRWWAHVPKAGCPVASLDDHQITEHDDGTITVSPSILWPDKWHGYLEHGVWREC